MKIACESCGAKYSIADEKVAGKVFKIRCKRCSEVIVVRGDQQGGAGAAAAGASGPAAGGGEPIWHVVINGDQAGPYAPDQLSEMLSNGTIDWEAYVWAEGFDNWVPMREVETLVAQISGGGAPAAAESRLSMSYDAAPDAFAAQPSMGADPFADEPPTTAHAGYAAAAAAAEPDLFGGGRAQAASPFDGGHVVASSPSPRTGGGGAGIAAAAPAAEAMTGARNENSVLFSLKNLQALATGSGGAPSMPAAAPGQERQGYAGGEGSGLIDIRALASATGVGENEGKDAKDELLSIGNQGAFGALGSPMLAPASDDDGGGKRMLIWAGVAGVGLLSAAAVAVAFIMRPAPSATPPAIVPEPPPPVVAPAATPDEKEPVEEKTEGERAAEEAAAAQKGTSEGSKPSEGSSRSRPKPSSSGSHSAPSEEPKAPATETKAPAKPSGPRTIDDLLDGALGGGQKPAAKPSAPAASNLPDSPSREDVLSAMGGLKGAVSACGGTGVATVSVSVAGATGRVTSAEVAGVTGPAGSCIAKAVRRASFPKFQQRVFKFKFPFKL